MSFCQQDGAFHPDFIDEITRVGRSIEGKRGKVGYPYTEQVDHAHRRVTARKITRDTAPELLSRVDGLIHILNGAVWKYDLDAELPLVMYLEYAAETGDLFHWHYDEDLGSINEHPRKLTCIVMLSDDGEFEGGGFEYRLPEMAVREVTFAKGTAVIFPSYMLHRVLPVTKGCRRTLVAWAHGPRWR